MPACRQSVSNRVATDVILLFCHSAPNESMFDSLNLDTLLSAIQTKLTIHCKFIELFAVAHINKWPLSYAVHFIINQRYNELTVTYRWKFNYDALHVAVE